MKSDAHVPDTCCAQANLEGTPMHVVGLLGMPLPTSNEVRCTCEGYSCRWRRHHETRMKSDAHIWATQVPETMVLESPTPRMTCESNIWCVQCCPLLAFHCSWRPRLSQEPHQRSEVLLLCSMRAWVWRCGVRLGVGWGGGLGWSWRLVRVCVCVCAASQGEFAACLFACLAACFVLCCPPHKPETGGA